MGNDILGGGDSSVWLCHRWDKGLSRVDRARSIDAQGGPARE